MPIKGKRQIPVEETHEEGAVPYNANVVYIGHIPDGFSEKPLRAYVSQFGEITNVVISRSAKTGRTRGYAFIQYAEESAASEAVQELHGTALGGRCLEAHLVHPDKVHKEIWTRKDQARRIGVDKERRTEGYKPRERHVPRDVSTLPAQLQRMITVEAKHNERLQSLGISYSFEGFAKQVGSV